MTKIGDSDQIQHHPSGENPIGPGRAILVTLIVCVVALALVTALNRDRPSVRSDVAPPTQENTLAYSSEENSPPEILSLTAATDRVQPFDLCDVICEAIHPDGEDLTYEWSASAGTIFGEGSHVEWGAPLSEGLYRIAVMVRDAHGGSDESSISLRVRANRPPQIIRMDSDTNWLPGSGSAYLWCEALDPDGDELTFQWSATGGELFGQGEAVIWQAPEGIVDAYWITVTVVDSYGGEARRALPITVTPRDPPDIRALIVEPLNTSMFKTHGDSWTIYRGRSCTIECVVEDGNGPFSYEWSADHGTLTYDGAVATWEAPNDIVGTTIVVTVTDRDGDKSTASALIYVDTCTCSF